MSGTTGAAGQARLRFRWILALAFLAGAGCGCGGDDNGPVPTSCLLKHWPRFRGPNGSGLGNWTADVPTSWRSTHTVDQLPTSWDAATGEDVLWQVPVPRRGGSSPVVWGDRVFLTGGDATTREVYCYDANTGDLLWRKPVEAPGGSPAQVSYFHDLTWAAPTPVTDGQYVYAIFGNGDVACLDYDGNQRWDVVNLGVPNASYGYSSSLALHGDLLLVQLDQDRDTDTGELLSRLVALDTGTGQQAWERTPEERQTACSYASPIVVTAAGRDQLITCANFSIISSDPTDGTDIWKVACGTGSPVDVVQSTIYANGLVIAVDNYAFETVAIRPDGTGDVTGTHVEWRSYEGTPEVCSPVSDGEFVLLSQYGTLTCLDAANGEELWAESLEGGGYSSPALVGDRIYVPFDDGTTVVVRANREAYQEIGKGSLKPDEHCNASPAFAGGRIYIRGKDTLYCVGRPSAP